MKTVAALGMVVLGLGVAVGCGDSNGPLMRPGENCMNCHGGGGHRWTVAGTVFACADADPSAGVEGVTVVITDGTGTEVTRLTTNAAGNFYTGMTMPATIHASLEQGTTKQAMITAQSTGACNSCHTVPSVNGAPGRLYISQAACGGATTDLAQDSATGN